MQPQSTHLTGRSVSSIEELQSRQSIGQGRAHPRLAIALLGIRSARQLRTQRSACTRRRCTHPKGL